MATERAGKRPSPIFFELVAAVFAVLICGVLAASRADAAAAIVTANGPIKGISIFGTQGYLGIPYAVPPVGNLRWKPPVPNGNWQGVFQANQFGNFCTQSGSGSEDCLTLNVFTPNDKKNQDKRKPLPVMVWIHGGGLVSGGSLLYDPSPLVNAGNLIVVTINYRLGLLGFFAHPAIDAEGHLNGNYGLMDQQLALKWVNRNIAAFGGDTSRITIFGESAGGQSVYAQLASPAAAGLFEGAIAESGAYAEFQDYWDFIVPVAEAEPSGEAIATALGCTSQTAECLRGLPASSLVSLNPSTAYPFVDGTILTQTPTSAFLNGQFNQVPVISGGNHDEWRIFVAGQYDFAGNPLVTPADYAGAVLALWGPALAPAVEFLYPLASFSSPGVALGASGTDGIFACPERNSVRLLSQYVPTFAYEFNDENAPDLFDPPASFPLGAYHGSEIQYLFDFDERFAGFNPFTPDQQSLSDAMVGYWTQFATTGDPNFSGAPTWSPYDSATDEFQSLIPPTPVPEATFAATHLCGFWNSF